jgi:hypothetical protein
MRVFNFFFPNSYFNFAKNGLIFIIITVDSAITINGCERDTLNLVMK